MNTPTAPAAVNAYFDALLTANRELYATAFTEDAVAHDPAGAQPIAGRELIVALLGVTTTWWSRYEGLTPKETFTSGDVTSVRWIGRGKTYDGRDINWAGITTFLLDDQGLIHTLYAVYDGEKLARELHHRQPPRLGELS